MATNGSDKKSGSQDTSIKLASEFHQDVPSDSTDAPIPTKEDEDEEGVGPGWGSISSANGGPSSRFFIYYLTFMATIGGFLFGYDTAVMSGAMLFIDDFFGLDTFWHSMIVSGTILTAAASALTSGPVVDKWGRPYSIMFASLDFVVGSITMAIASDRYILLVGRLIVGVGIGITSMAVPLYIAEASPADIRGQLVTMNQLFITIGIVVSSTTNGLFSYVTEGWRYMLGIAAGPAIVQFIGFLFLPESPRHLMAHGDEEKAKAVLQKLRDRENVNRELREIRDNIEEDRKQQQGSVLGRVFSTPHVRKALFMGCTLQMFQQFCGINTIIYYSGNIIKMAGFSTMEANWMVLIPNGVNFLATFIGLWAVERIGRKKLLVGSLLGLVTACTILAIGFHVTLGTQPDVDHKVTVTFKNGTTPTDKCITAKYKTCEDCVDNKDCGFCYMDDGDKGTCVKTHSKKGAEDGAAYGRCLKDNFAKSKPKWAHGFCPTKHTWIVIIGLASFVLAFAPGMGPMPWVITAEIFPTWARGTCISITTGANWACNFVVAMSFLHLTNVLTRPGTFWMFAGICGIATAFSAIFVPETKDKTLEEVEQLFMGDSERQAMQDKKQAE